MELTSLFPSSSLLPIAFPAQNPGELTGSWRDALITTFTLADNVGSATLTVTSDTLTPVITVTTPANNSYTTQALINITGNVSETVTFAINGIEAVLNPDLTFNQPLTIDEGPNAIALTATDLAGNNAVVELNVTLDTSVPVLTLAAPAPDTLTTDPSVIFSGSVSEPVTLTINGQAVQQEPDNSFSAAITLPEGPNAVAVSRPTVRQKCPVKFCFVF